MDGRQQLGKMDRSIRLWDGSGYHRSVHSWKQLDEGLTAIPSMCITISQEDLHK